jgi:hypothetical protein
VRLAVQAGSNACRGAQSEGSLLTYLDVIDTPSEHDEHFLREVLDVVVSYPQAACLLLR